MASTFTPNLDIEKPARGDDVGTWDTPVNANMSVIDSKLGTVQAISLAGGSLTLSQTQTQSAFLNFTGALPSNVTVTIPGLSSAPGTTISGYFFTVQNQCSNSSAYTVTLATTVSGQQQIAVPPYNPTTILVEGTNSSQAGSVKFASLPLVGAFWDYAGSSVPNWVSACTVPPYLNCDGTTFSSGTYPALAVVLGGTTLPDLRGRIRAYLNQGQARITTAVSGVDGDTNLSAGGAQSVTIGASNVPALSVTIVDPGHVHQAKQTLAGTAAGGANPVSQATGLTDTTSAVTNITATANDGSPNSALGSMPPVCIAGITMIRSA